MSILKLFKKVWTFQSIVKLYMEGKYDEASKKLNSSRVIAIGAYKQWHKYYDALILIANEEYLEAEEILNNIKLRKIEKQRLFWLCYTYINLGELDEANNYYVLLNKLCNKEVLERKILTFIFDYTNDNSKKLDNHTYTQIKNPVIIKYISDNYVENNQTN